MISDATIARLRANAAESRAIIEARDGACHRCGAVHPRTFEYRGRVRGWHDVSAAQATPAQNAARARAA